ncbi:MAG: hypothetical protein KA968_15370 [Chitinophagaceae bacterium]|jgi:hypothetical protein|nr:hypothetical protein [Chitinophagaceae bacterium]MBP8116070.1 hypothetical protein [Chitinophagaceae bacterium]
MNNIENLINELTIIRSATHSQDDYRNFTICIEKVKEYLINDYPETINEAAEKAYPSTVNPDTGNDENWYNKQIWKEGAVWGTQNKGKSYSGKEVSEMMKSSFKAGKRQIQCTCDNEIKTGQTSVMCCNICGKPDEHWWSNGPLSFKEVFKKQLEKKVLKNQQALIIDLQKENELLMRVIDKLINASKPKYNDEEKLVIKNSIDRHFQKGA